MCTVLTVAAQLSVLVVPVMGVRLGAGIAVIVVQTVLATVVVVLVGVLFAGHLLVVGIVFLVTVASVARIVARSVA